MDIDKEAAILFVNGADEKTIADFGRKCFAEGQKKIVENLSPPMYYDLGTTGYISDRMGNIYQRKA
jgi:hypothetical protein